MPNHNVVELLLRLGCNVLSVFFVVQLVFQRLYRRRELAFSFWILNLVTFAVAFMLSGVETQLGLSLGLFAVFGILRYRTEAMKIRELSYLFAVVGLGILNGVGSLQVTATMDVVLVLCVTGLQLLVREDSMAIKYDKVQLLRPENQTALLKDLSERLGVEALRVHVEALDLLRESADLTVTYRCA